MTTLLEIEAAIEQLSAAERAKLSQWWQEHFDPDEGLELREEVADELDAARREIARGNDPRRYDFSDIAGRLQWQGDAVTEQRRLRDEW